MTFLYGCLLVETVCSLTCPLIIEGAARTAFLESAGVSAAFRKSHVAQKQQHKMARMLQLHSTLVTVFVLMGSNCWRSREFTERRTQSIEPNATCSRKSFREGLTAGALGGLRFS